MLEEIKVADTMGRIKMHQADMKQTLISVGAIQEKYSLSKMNSNAKTLMANAAKADPAGHHKFLNQYITNYENLLCLNEKEKGPGSKDKKDSCNINKNIAIDFTELELLRLAN